MRELLAAGAELEHRDAEGDTVLLAAAEIGHAAAIAALVRAGASLQAANRGGLTALAIASVERHAAAIEVLARAQFGAAGRPGTPSSPPPTTSMHRTSSVGTLNAEGCTPKSVRQTPSWGDEPPPLDLQDLEGGGRPHRRVEVGHTEPPEPEPEGPALQTSAGRPATKERPLERVVELLGVRRSASVLGLSRATGLPGRSPQSLQETGPVILPPLELHLEPAGDGGAGSTHGEMLATMFSGRLGGQPLEEVVAAVFVAQVGSSPLSALHKVPI
jgi:hypothetical protein